MDSSFKKVKGTNFRRISQILKVLRDILFKIAGAQNSTFEEKYNIVVAILGSVLTIIFIGSFGVFRTIQFFMKITNVDNYFESQADGILAIIEIICTIILVVNLFLVLFLLKAFDVYYLIWIITTQFSMFSIHVLSGRGNNSVALTTSLLFMLYVSIYYHKLWTIPFDILDGLLISFFYFFDLVYPPKVNNDIQAISSFAPVGFIVVLLVSMLTKEYFRNKRFVTFKNLTKLITSLDFNSDNSKKLLGYIEKINSQNSPKFLIYVKEIILRMNELRSFLPMSLVQDNTISLSSHSGSITSSQGSKSSQNEMKTSNTPNTEKSLDKGQVITYMVVQIQDFDKIQDELSFESLVKLQEKYLNIIDGIVTQYRGKILHFDADIVRIVFNAVEKTVFHQNHACSASVRIIETFKKKKDEFESPNLDSRICISLTSSNAFFKNMGNKTIKRFTVVGKCISFNHLLQAKSRFSGGYPAGIIACEPVRNNIKYHFETSILDYDSKFKVFLYKILRSKKIKENEEWNYVLNSEDLGIQDNKSEEQLVNAWTHYKEENYQKSKKILDKYDGNISETVTILEKKLKKKLHLF